MTLVSILGSLALVLTIAPALLGTFCAIDWLVCLLFPLFITTPLGFSTFLQERKLKVVSDDLTRVHAQLAAAHCRLSGKASRDEMIGMLNRENFLAALDGSRCKNDRGALSVIDADHFKQINESFCYLTGDQALLQIAAAITRGVRSGDILGRISGEEFGAFLVGASEEESKLIAERISGEVERVHF